MMKIFFEVAISEDTYISFEDIMYRSDYNPDIKSSYRYERGLIGRVTIQFYNYKFVIKEEYIARVLLTCYVNAANSILNGKTYEMPLEDLYKDRLTFDYIDCEKVGVRIRQYTLKYYENDAEEVVFCSGTNYMIQEIMVPRREFVEQTIICAEQYFAYLEKVINYPESDLNSCKKIVKELKEQFNNLQ